MNIAQSPSKFETAIHLSLLVKDSSNYPKIVEQEEILNLKNFFDFIDKNFEAPKYDSWKLCYQYFSGELDSNDIYKIPPVVAEYVFPVVLVLDMMRKDKLDWTGGASAEHWKNFCNKYSTLIWGAHQYINTMYKTNFPKLDGIVGYIQNPEYDIAKEMFWKAEKEFFLEHPFIFPDFGIYVTKKSDVDEKYVDFRANYVCPYGIVNFRKDADFMNHYRRGSYFLSINRYVKI